MLKSLHVKNFALLDEIEVEFAAGLNIITGETGAGKSILIDALGSTLGEKVDEDVLRTGADKAIVEGIFSLGHNTEIQKKLQMSEIDSHDNTIILRKEVHQSGRNRAFINDTPVTSSDLTSFGDLLVDLHGQHEHQALLKIRHHLGYLDDYGAYKELLLAVQNSYQRLTHMLEEIAALKSRQKSLTERKDIFEYQIKEISAINPQAGEEDELLKEEKILLNSEKLFELTGDLYSKLYESEGSALDIISEASERLSELERIDQRFESFRRECQSAKVIIDELSKFLQSYHSAIEFNPERLEHIRTRLAQFSGLKKKYGGTIEEIVGQRQKIENELNCIENLDETIAESQKQVEKEREILSDLCVHLSAERGEAAQRLEVAVIDALSQLGMSGAQFKIQIEQVIDKDGLVKVNGRSVKANIRGVDQVEFFISANAGEELKPLARVASGGEVSRIMLAIKSALTEADRIPVLIFDEIDIGISGRIAQAVGRSLKRLAQSHQIICITHLPQIASMADHHFVVEKFSDGQHTHTEIRKLAEEERPIEIAKLLGGDVITDIHIQGAKELLIQAQGS